MFSHSLLPEITSCSCHLGPPFPYLESGNKSTGLEGGRREQHVSQERSARPVHSERSAGTSCCLYWFPVSELIPRITGGEGLSSWAPTTVPKALVSFCDSVSPRFRDVPRWLAGRPVLSRPQSPGVSHPSRGLQPWYMAPPCPSRSP